MEILDAILGGQVDGELDQIVTAVKQRRDIVAQRQVAGIRPGMTVRLAQSGIKPTYLQGIEVVVEKVNDKTVSCRAKDPDALPSRRYAYGIRVPFAMIQVA